MALIEFQVPYPIGWRGKTYQVGLQLIPEELAVALGWQAEVKIEIPSVKSKTTRILPAK
ncbi:hypothetical protein COO91_03361 [Nostoc flagelliforme CCNUN1]|uniref:Uncharacterized protein n=1 Tax=Nostoc flagelliforme CCNUN1 TaxID=2038116 RepID=A0A2K8SPM2_9NOSO|nr:hypothetical protein [Nostoc flagelliforme]AUB37416.1 hypothetical protein COO91_03361 [Nostoc flagelliforme CCNUN1]